MTQNTKYNLTLYFACHIAKYCLDPNTDPENTLNKHDHHSLPQYEVVSGSIRDTTHPGYVITTLIHIDICMEFK